jgi:outer membrane biosynthesis protein TonB
MRLGQDIRRTRKDASRRWWLALLLSLGVHVPVGALLWYLASNSDPPPHQDSVRVPISLLDVKPSQDGTAPSLSAAMAKEAETESPSEEIDGTEVPVGQMVSVAPTRPEEMPDRPAFAARYAQKVEREVLARFPPSDRAVPPPPPPPRAAARKEAAGGGSSGTAANPSPGAGALAGAGPGEFEGEGAGTGTGSGVGEGAGDGSGLASGQGPGDGLAPFGTPLAAIDPAAKYSPSAGSFGTDEYLPQVAAQGDVTELNTVPYRYIGFFERVKQRVKQHWDPNTPYRRRDPSGHLYGHKDRLTVISVVLDEEGRILDTRVSDTSGLKFLDDEAIRAFWAAGPFNNPPRGLVGEDKRVRFDFGFAFLVATSRHNFFWRF